jgi:hypothetical protein
MQDRSSIFNPPPAPVNNATNDNLARLLATENLRIVYDGKAETASFDTKDRLLTMPVLSNKTHDEAVAAEMLLAHEVGHALFTPAGDEVALAAINRIDPKNKERAKLFLNIVEDARIEREMQDRYPGLRRTFLNGYKGLLSGTQMFDGLLDRDINTMPLIDRINLHFKLGIYAGVEIPFSPEEQVFVDRVNNTKSFDEVVDVCEDIYTHQADTSMQIPNPMKGKATDGDGDPSDLDIDGDPVNGDKQDDSGFSQKIIDAARRKQTVPIKGEAVALTLPTYDPAIGNLPTSKVIEAFSKSIKWNETSLIDGVIRFNKSAVIRMVADFERKKSASEFHKSSVSRTGILDMTRIHQYRHDDELFLTAVDIRKGKSHGLVFVLDWSSSMSSRMMACISQLSCLISFCRATKIPYEVYAFSSSGVRMSIDEAERNKKSAIEMFPYKGGVTSPSGGDWYSDVYTPNTPCVDPHFCMIRFTGSEVKEADEKRILNLMLLHHYNVGVGESMGIENPYNQAGGMWHDKRDKWFPIMADHILSLSGTPLDEATLACLQLVPAFKAKHRLDMVNCIFLTDGESTSRVMYHYDSKGRQQNPAATTTYTYNGKHFVLMGKYADHGVMFRDIFRQITGCNLVNFFMVSKPQLSRFKTRLLDGDTSVTVEDDFIERRNHCGWDSHFTVCFDDRSENVGDVEQAMESATTVVKIKNAFIRGMSRIGSSRVLLNRITDYITKSAGLVSTTRKQGVLDANG